VYEKFATAALRCIRLLHRTQLRFIFDDNLERSKPRF